MSFDSIRIGGVDIEMQQSIPDHLSIWLLAILLSGYFLSCHSKNKQLSMVVTRGGASL